MNNQSKRNPKGAGRPKGAPNKATKEIKDMIKGALEEKGGQQWLVEQMEKNPVAFMSLLGKIIPAEIKQELTGKDGGPVDAVVRFVVKGFKGNASN